MSPRHILYLKKRQLMMNIVKIIDKISLFLKTVCPLRSKDYNREDMFVVIIAHGDDATILSQHEKSAQANHFKHVFTESTVKFSLVLCRRAVKLDQPNLPIPVFTLK